jgi:hypothetical protein
VAIAVFAIVFFGLLGLGLTVLKPEADTPAAGTTASVETTVDESANVDEFLDSYEQSFVGPYALTGMLEFANDQARTRSRVRRARIGEKSLDQIGDGAVVGRADGERLCSNSGTEFLCAEPMPEPTLAQRRVEMEDRIKSGVGYRIAKNSEGCFVLTARGDDPSSPLGVESVYCFDPSTGAVASRSTSKGRRTESFVASEISATVSDEDLAPQ